MQDTDMGDFERDAPVSEDDIGRLRRANSPRAMGVTLTVFVAILIIMIGGLASYYYYSVQKQGSSQEQTIQGNWDEIVLATTDLTNSFNKVSDFNALFDDTKGSFQDTLNSSNRALKDVSYNLQSISGYALSGGVVVTKMQSFTEGYLDYLRELQSVIDKGRGGSLSNISEVDELNRLSTAMNGAYDNLLSADRSKMLASSLPSDLFEMSGGVEDFVQKYLDNKKQQGEAEDAEKTAAQGVVNKFMQAYMGKDANGMKLYLTDQAKSEFNPGVLEDATEIKSFEITGTRKLSDTRIEIDATIQKETPDKGAQTEKRRFALLKKNNTWQIDSWNVV